jgi:hypothetical protein
MSRPYRIVARLKNNRLWSAACRAFSLDPTTASQSAIGRALGLDPSTIGHLLNMRKWPGKRGSDGSIEWTDRALDISAMVAEPPEWLFDPSLYGRQANRLSIEVSEQQVIGDGGIKAIEDRVTVAQCHTRAALSPRAKAITLGEEDPRISKGRVHQIRKQAVRKMHLDALYEKYGPDKLLFVTLPAKDDMVIMIKRYLVADVFALPFRQWHRVDKTSLSSAGRVRNTSRRRWERNYA